MQVQIRLLSFGALKSLKKKGKICRDPRRLASVTKKRKLKLVTLANPVNNEMYSNAVQ